MTFTDIVCDVEDGMGRITINRPLAMNAYTGHTLDELTRAFCEFGNDSSVAVLVLTGAGERAFCAGGDVNWEAEGGLDGHAATRAVMRLYAAMRHTLKPCIARVNGYAIGGGHHLQYFCDFAIAADHAVFGQNGPRVGSPAQGWIVSYLVRMVGARRAREIWMLCRRYSASQALDWGLVNAVVPLADLDAEVERWVAQLLSLSPTCLRVLKKTFDDEYAPLRYVQGHRDFLAEINPSFWESGEQREGAAAFLEKRQPDFSPWR
jgi:dihydroxynaphthoic acid synthetase